MKKVFRNSSEVIHVWAQQTQSEGRCSNVYFEGTTRLYSYGSHYPLGLFVENKKGEKAVIININGYSSTTTGHISDARYATNQYKQFLLPNTEAMMDIEHCYRYNWNETNLTQANKNITIALSAAIVRRVESYFYSLRCDTKKRKAATLESWKNAALSICNDYIAILDWYGFKMTAEAKKALAKLSGLSPVEAKEAAQKAATLEARKREKERAKQQKENAAMLELCIPAWKAGHATFEYKGEIKQTRGIASSDTVYLRIVNDEIETSKGAKFSVSEALKLWPMLQAFALRKEACDFHIAIANRDIKEYPRLGHYNIDKIQADGTIHAGCHIVKFDEVARIATQLNVA